MVILWKTFDDWTDFLETLGSSKDCKEIAPGAGSSVRFPWETFVNCMIARYSNNLGTANRADLSRPLSESPFEK